MLDGYGLAFGGDAPPFVHPERIVVEDWGVFYEKAPNVKAALAAILTWSFGATVCPRVFYPHSRGVLRWTRCIMGYHRSGAAISTAASKAKTPSAVADNGGFNSSSDRPGFSLRALFSYLSFLYLIFYAAAEDDTGWRCGS